MAFTMGRRVAIIGAGASGLPAIKCCLDEGLHPVCFEKTDSIGGLWNFREEAREGQACIMAGTHINTSKEMTCYSDFPFPKEFPNFFHNTKMMEYFNIYCEHFDLKKFIRFKHEVRMVSKAKDFGVTGQWTVRYRNLASMEDREETFDFVMVCPGHYSDPKEMTFEGQEQFVGVITHSHDVKRGSDFQNQRVVVVGVGDSAMDVVSEMAHCAKQVYMVTRRGVWLLPITSNGGLPYDLELISRVARLKFQYFPGYLERRAAKELNRHFDHTLYGLQPKHRLSGGQASVSHTMPGLILRGAVIVKPGVKRLTKTGVVFEDGTEAENIDSIITCTGYISRLPFIDKSVVDIKENQNPCYLYMFPHHLEKNSLALIGIVHSFGGTLPVVEMQSRMAVRVFKNEVQLPSPEAMQRDISERKAALMKRFYTSTRFTMVVDYIPYMDELAEMVGCKPNLWKYFFTNNRLWREMFLGGCTPAQYRLKGPGKWTRAEDTILTTQERIRYPIQTRQVSIVTCSGMPTAFFIQRAAILALATAGIWYYLRTQNVSPWELVESVAKNVTPIGSI